MLIETSSAIVYLIDDELVIRDSLKCLIESIGLKTKCFDSAIGFLTSYDRNLPGCLILDVRMPFMGGLELQEELLKRDIHIPIIFISGNADIPETARAFRAGALDFLEKPFDNDVLLERIHEALKLDIQFKNKNLENEKVRVCFDRLTVREKEVLRLIVEHNSTKQVAKKLSISPRTIDAHRARIMEKMQADNIIDLVAKVLSYPMLYDEDA